MSQLSNFFITNKIKLILGAFVVVSSLFIIFYIKDKIKANQLTNQTEQITKLNTILNKEKKDKSDKEGEVIVALAAFESQKTRAETAEAKLAKLKPVVIPTIPTATISPECIEELQSVKTQYDAREVIFQDVIVEQKETIDLAVVTIDKLKEEVKIDNTIIKTHEEKDVVTEKENSLLKTEVKVQTHRKEVYRGISGGLLIVVLILVF